MLNHPRPKFTFLGHATVRCDLPDGKVMLIDPWVGQNPSCPDELKEFDRLDAILITHAHFDHIADVEAVAKTSAAGIAVIRAIFAGASPGDATARLLRKWDETLQETTLR